MTSGQIYLETADNSEEKGVLHMINEVLFMEMRLIQQFCKKHQCLSKDANALFNKYGIWKYIEECYDTLHMNGDEYILNGIDEIVIAQGGVL